MGKICNISQDTILFCNLQTEQSNKFMVIWANQLYSVILYFFVFFHQKYTQIEAEESKTVRKTVNVKCSKSFRRKGHDVEGHFRKTSKSGRNSQHKRSPRRTNEQIKADEEKNRQKARQKGQGQANPQGMSSWRRSRTTQKSLEGN